MTDDFQQGQGPSAGYPSQPIVSFTGQAAILLAAMRRFIGDCRDQGMSRHETRNLMNLAINEIKEAEGL